MPDFHDKWDKCPTDYQIFFVTLRMATLYKILILCVCFALSCNLWAQSYRSCYVGKEASDEPDR